MSTDNLKCKYCSKECISKSVLEKHERIHTQEKPFKCSFKDCKQAFTQKSNLKRHLQWHNDEKNFECFLCRKRFLTQQNLSLHYRSHENKKRKRENQNLYSKKGQQISYEETSQKGISEESSINQLGSLKKYSTEIIEESKIQQEENEVMSQVLSQSKQCNDHHSFYSEQVKPKSCFLLDEYQKESSSLTSLPNQNCSQIFSIQDKFENQLLIEEVHTTISSIEDLINQADEQFFSQFLSFSKKEYESQKLQEYLNLEIIDQL